MIETPGAKIRQNFWKLNRPRVGGRCWGQTTQIATFGLRCTRRGRLTFGSFGLNSSYRSQSLHFWATLDSYRCGTLLMQQFTLVNSGQPEYVWTLRTENLYIFLQRRDNSFLNLASVIQTAWGGSIFGRDSNVTI